MKMTKVSMLAAGAAAIMAATMLTGCGDVIVKNPDTEAADKAVTAVTAQTTAATPAAAAAMAEADKPAENTAASQPVVVVEEKAETSQPVVIIQDKAADAQPEKTEAKLPETKIPEKKAEKKAETKKNEQTLPQYTPVKVDDDLFTGSFVEKSQGTATMEITDNGDSSYSVHIVWPVNLSEVNSWDLTGSFDKNGVMNYTNCRKTTSAYDKNGNYTIGVDGIQTPFTTYTAGAGSLKITDYGIVWTDSMGDILAGTTFVNTTSYRNIQVTNTTDTAENNNYVVETMPAVFPTGSFYDPNSNKAWLDVFEVNGEYFCTVTCADGYGKSNVWTFSGYVADGKISYTCGTQNVVYYKADGSLDYFETISNSHSGSLRMSNTGIVWEDNDGSSYVFINDSLIG